MLFAESLVTQRITPFYRQPTHKTPYSIYIKENILINIYKYLLLVCCFVALWLIFIDVKVFTQPTLFFAIVVFLSGLSVFKKWLVFMRFNLYIKLVMNVVFF